MTGETNDRTCRACGVTGNAETFYVCNYGKQGQPLLETICKRCKKRQVSERKRKFAGEYRTLEQIRATAKGARAIRPSIQKCYKKYGVWAKAIQRASMRCNGKGRTGRYGVWTSRIDSAAGLLRTRERVYRRPRHSLRPRDSWGKALREQMIRLRKRKDDKYGEWTNKIRSTVHNWRLKARHRAGNVERIVGNDPKTGLQMCFDWLRADAEERNA